MAANLETELGRLAGTAKAPTDGDRGRRVASRFLSDMSAIFARNRPVLEALGERYRLGVVSNFYGNLEAVCQSSGLAPLFAVMTDSRQVGAEKPDPAIFRAALDALRARRRRQPFSSAIPCAATARARGARAWASSGSRPKTSRPPPLGRPRPRPYLAAVTRLPDLLNVLK